jgi:hypothetical protein
MALANLHVSERLPAAISATAADSSSRALEVVVDVSKLELAPGGTWPAAGSLAEDVETLAKAVADGTPRMWLFKLEDGKWMPVVFVSDSVEPRLKLLFASSTEQIKGVVGHTSCRHPYSVSTVSDLTASAFSEWFASATDTDSSKAMTEEEIHLAAIKRAELVSSVDVEMSSGGSGGVVPFGVAADVTEALTRLLASTAACMGVLLRTTDETLALDGFVDSRDALPSLMPPEEPRFLVLRDQPQKGVVFAYYCPDTAGIRLKMVYSTAKSVMLQHLRAKCPAVSTLECSTAAELQTDLDRHETPAAASTGVALASASVSTAGEGFNKPQRPGRRRK